MVKILKLIRQVWRFEKLIGIRFKILKCLMQNERFHELARMFEILFKFLTFSMHCAHMIEDKQAILLLYW